MLVTIVNPDVLLSPQEWTDLKVWSLPTERWRRPTSSSCLESIHEHYTIFCYILHKSWLFRRKAFCCSTHVVTSPYISSSAASCGSGMYVVLPPERCCLQLWRAKERTYANGTAPRSNPCYSLISQGCLLIVLDSRLKSPNVAKNTLGSY